MKYQRKSEKTEEMLNMKFKQTRHSIFDRIHTPSESILSNSSQTADFRGVINLSIVLMIISNSNNYIRNAIKLKDGILFLLYEITSNPINLIFYVLFQANLYVTFMLSVSILLTELLFFCISLERSMGSKKWIKYFSYATLLFMVIFPACVVLFSSVQPILSGMTLLWYIMVWMKMFSYRQFYTTTETPPNQAVIEKAQNKSLSRRDLYYFLAAPTLCFEENFPRTTKRCNVFLMKRIFEFIALSILGVALIQGLIVPVLDKYHGSFPNIDLIHTFELLFELMVPAFMSWLIMFYAFFHSFLNLSAEILLFADRSFYGDWWNSQSIAYFWKNWNIPVHRWCKRHIFVPLMNSGYSKYTCFIVVFLISAIMHELLVSVPTRCFRLWFFVGMFLQVPLALFLDLFSNGRIRNILFWISILINQSCAFSIYFHDFYFYSKD